MDGRGSEERPERPSDSSDLAERFHQALSREGSASSSSGTPFDTTKTTSDDLFLGRLALEANLIKQDQLTEALEEQRRARARGEEILLGQLFVRRGWANPVDLSRLLSEQNRRTAGFPDLPRYEARGLIGQGATAFVYRAWDRELGRLVAVKVLRETAALSEIPRARFKREAQVAAGISHPNVLTVFDAGESAGHLYLVMELVEGKPLADVLKEGKTPESTLLGHLEKAAQGVAAAHAKGIVHRDLKPANILLTASGEPKVGDFGLAHLVESSTELTKTGTTLGTPLYMSPEQVEGRTKDISAATDVYALGAILYEILVHRPPHTGENTGEIYARIVRDEPVPPRKLKPEVARDVETIALKALDKVAARRYPTAHEFSEDLRRHLAGDPILARPISLPLRLWRRGRRRPVIPLAACAALLLGGLLVASSASASARKAARIRETLDLASKREKMGSLAEARAAFEMVISEDRENEAARAGLSRTETELARREKAEKEAGTLLETARASLEASLRCLYDRQATPEDFEKHVGTARSLVEEAIRKAGESPAAQYLHGRALELDGDEAGGEAATRRAIGLDPDFAPARYQLGRFLLSRAYRMELASSPDEREARRSESERLAREGAAHIEQAISKARGLEDALHREVARALLAWVSGDRERTLQAAQAGLERFPRTEGREEFHWIRGLATSGEGQIEAFTQALEIRPKWPLVLLARAGAQLAKGNADAALADCEAALRIHPADVYARFNCAIARSQTGDWEGAIQDLDQVLETTPADAMARYNRGVARQRKGDLDQALADFEETLRRAPRFAPAFNNRGRLRSRKGDLEAAIRDFDEALRLKPEFAEALSNRGSARLDKGDVEGALSDLSEAVRINPTFAEAHYNRALARIKKEDVQGVLEDLGRAIDLRPTWSAPYILRAKARKALGSLQAAQEDARKALRFGVDPKDRAELESILKTHE